ncbi:hypothetical protein Dimus_013318 [Dionaea muscipula]
MNWVTTEDGELRSQLECRRSRWVSPSLRDSVTDLGPVRKGGLLPIEEEEVTGGECSAAGEFPNPLLASSLPIGIPVGPAQSYTVSLPLPSPIEEVGTSSYLSTASVEEERTLSSLLAPLVSATEAAADLVAVDDADDLVPEVVEVEVQAVDGGRRAVTAPGVSEVGPSGSLLSSPFQMKDAALAALSGGEHDGAALLTVPDLAMGDGVAGKITGGLADFLVAHTGGNSVIPVTSVNYVSPSPLVGCADSEAPLLSGCDGIVDKGGMVSEEGLVSLTAREALRPPPTDGRRQPPLLPVEPAMMIGRGGLGLGAGGGLPLGGGGLDNVVRMGGDGGGGQSSRIYAHVVLPDRRADVELSYCPPADGGNFITMAESDRDAERWGSCLVGYFLQGSLPFGYVRSTVSRLWMKSGLIEVNSLDDGFYVFRFADSLSRDAVLEGGPWFVGGKPFLLRKWECLLSLTKETLSKIPVWASFFNVLLEYWTAAGLSRIASVIGQPIHLDRYTASRERLSYARVCIEVDAAGPCHREVRLRCGDREVLVKVKFDWFPARCEMCRVFGHATSGCPAQPRVPSRPAPPFQPEMTESAPTGLRTPSRGTWTIGVGGTVEAETDHLGWRVSQRRGHAPTTVGLGMQQQRGPGSVGAETSRDGGHFGRD